MIFLPSMQGVLVVRAMCSSDCGAFEREISKEQSEDVPQTKNWSRIVSTQTQANFKEPIDTRSLTCDR